ncbi:MAG TPA: hypothetical protein VNL16_19175, partial [Chloroflexota bacterium]|nr:hypothetical protein [Chloroflexota bacterium]
MSAGSVAYPAGSLVRARGRDWVVLPGSDADVLVLRPLTGGDDEVAGVFLPLEGAGVTPASFALPDSARTGDVAGCLLLQDAADLVVLDVLIRKAKTIRQRLGVSVPVPVQSEQVVQAVVDSVLL